MIETIYVGATANDGTGDPLRDAMIIINNNFLEIENDYMLITGTLSISQVIGLQTALDNIQIELNNIPLLEQDIVDINIIIGSINSTLNNQNLSILELQSDLMALQILVDTKIGEAPIDGNEYVRKNGDWSIKSDNTSLITPTETYVGVRLKPTSATVSGFLVDRNGNNRTGYEVYNPSTGNGAVSAFVAGNAGFLDQLMSMQYFGSGYYLTYLRNKGAIYSTNTLYNISTNRGGFIWRSGVDFNSTNEVFKVNDDKSIQLSPVSVIGITGSTGKIVVNSGASNRPTIYNGTEWKGLAYLDDFTSPDLDVVLGNGDTAYGKQILLISGIGKNAVIGGDEIRMVDVATDEALYIRHSNFEFIGLSGTTQLIFENPTVGGILTIPSKTGTLATLDDITGGGVESVSGDGVDNTDPLNPVITWPTTLDLSAETTTNKATDFTTINDTLYPSVQAVEDRIDLIPIVDDNACLNWFPTGGIITLNNYIGYVINTSFSSTVTNANNITRFQPFVTNKAITIDELYLSVQNNNAGATATATLYVYDDSNDGLPGVKLHQEESATNIFNTPNTIVTFGNDFTLQPGVYWFGIHIRYLNLASSNPAFYFAALGGNTKGYQTAAITFTNNYQGVLGVAATPGDLTDNPTILVSSSTALLVPMLKIKLG